MTYDYQLFPDTGRGPNTGECGSIPRIIDQGASFNDCKKMCSERSDCGYTHVHQIGLTTTIIRPLIFYISKW